MRKDGPDNTVVEMAGLRVSKSPDDLLVTYSLGSCVGVTFYDPVNKIGGMIHCMLPLSSTDPEKAAQKPSMFVDTGIIKLIQDMLALGAIKKNFICKVAGAGAPLQDSGIFRIGERNYAVLRKILWKNDILISGELIGGQSAKTMYLTIASGKTTLRINGKDEVEL